MSAALAKTEAAALTPMEVIDHVEARLLALGGSKQGRGEVLPQLPVRHHFTPGLYCREITMQKGAVLTSAIHRTEHPFVVSKGRCLVYLNRDDGWQEIRAPYFGVTKPGSRRVLVILEETVWTTFHPTELTDLLAIEDALLDPRENPLLAKESA
jgi:hypothetical protein